MLVAFTTDLAVSDTEAGSCLIGRDRLTINKKDQIRPLLVKVNLRSTNEKQAPLVRAINLGVQIEKVSVDVACYADKWLGTSVITECNYGGTPVEAIKSRKRGVERDDGSTVPIVCKPLQASTNVAILEERQ